MTTRPLEQTLLDFSECFAYGTTDDGHSKVRRRLALARRRRLSLTCTPLSDELACVLSSAAFDARVVLAFTRDELDDEDNGHTLVEIREDNDGWALYDPSFCAFLLRGGRRLSLPEWCRAVADNDYEIEELEGTLPPLGFFTPAASRLRERMEGLVASEEARRRWYRRIAGVPLVRQDDSYIFSADDPLAQRLSAYSPSYRPVEPARFRALWA
jgi:hypothetical protein